MNYRKDIERSVAYIEKYIRRKPTAREIAGVTGYSLHPFTRLFTQYHGIPPVDYVRKHRLSLARTDLLRNLDFTMNDGTSDRTARWKSTCP